MPAFPGKKCSALWPGPPLSVSVYIMQPSLGFKLPIPFVYQYDCPALSPTVSGEAPAISFQYSLSNPVSWACFSVA